MKIKEKALNPTISDENPFGQCQLGREKYADVLTGVVNTFNDGFVMALDNKWGSGKTTFINMWKAKLEKNGQTCLYFNAWENDFEKDVLVSFLAELTALDDVQEETYKDLLKMGAPLLKNIIPSLASSIINKYVGDDFLQNFLKGISEVSSDSLSNAMTEYADRKKGIVEFKNSLEKYVQVTTSGNRPIVFFIDELDRCKPSYAVEVLETIKHFFAVDGIVFVLSVDKKQLANAIRGYYGSDEIDGDDYLNRFINVDYSLPEPDTKLYCNFLFNHFKFNDFFGFPDRMNSRALQNDPEDLKQYSATLFKAFNLSLREQFKIFAHVKIALNSFAFNEFSYPPLLMYLLIIKSKFPLIFSRIKTKSFTIQQLADEFSIHIPEEMKSGKELSHMTMVIEYLLILTYGKYLGSGDPKPITDGKPTGPLEFESTLGIENENDILQDWLEGPQSFERSPSLNHFLNKIELLVDLENKERTYK